MRRFIEVPIQLLDIEGDGIHIMVKGTIHGKEAHFLIDTGASRTVFDPTRMEDFVEDLRLEPKEGKNAGVGGSDLETFVFQLDSLSIGDMEIRDYQAVALDLSNVHEMYASLGLPRIDGILGGDVLRRYKAVINYRSKKLRLTPR